MALQAGRDPNPPFVITSLLIREQHFGIAEGNPWIMALEPNKSLEQHFAERKFPVLGGRSEKFPEGESLDDVSIRADEAIEELVMPHIWKAAREGRKGINIAVVSHGLCISEVTAYTREESTGVLTIFHLADSCAAEERRKTRTCHGL